MITDTLQNQINTAFKKGEEIRVSTLRLLSAALHDAEIANKREKLTEDQELAIVKQEAKKRKEAIEIYTNAGATDRADKETKELEILQEFLPEELSDEEINRIVDETIQQYDNITISDMGKVMSTAMQKIAGQADGSRVSQVVKNKLTHD